MKDKSMEKEPSYRLGIAISIIEGLMGKSLIEGRPQDPKELRLWKTTARQFIKKESKERGLDV